MNRLSLALFATLAVGCGPKEFSSVCGEVGAPETCGQACDPSPGAAATCGAGAHCTPDGLCDAVCGPTKSCGDGYTCTADGSCIDDGSGSGPFPDAMACPAVNFTPMPTTPSILLVLDRSGSMAEDITNHSPAAQANWKYTLMRTALTGTAGVVTGLQAKAYFGAGLYGCDGGNVLLNPVARALNNATSIDAYLNAGNPNGGTPTAKAINEAVQTFSGAGAPPANSPPVIVLATDGAPNNCSGGAPQGGFELESENAAAAAFAANIPVYVLAINAGNAGHFQKLANAGQGVAAGQPNAQYFPANNAAQLQAAFQTIINGVISCDLTLTGTIDESQAASGTVTVNGVTLTYGTDWILVGGTTIRVQGQACTTLKASATPTVNAQFPCGAVIF